MRYQSDCSEQTVDLSDLKGFFSYSPGDLGSFSKGDSAESLKSKEINSGCEWDLLRPQTPQTIKDLMVRSAIVVRFILLIAKITQNVTSDVTTPFPIQPPNWESDDMIYNCCFCRCEFTWRSRKHHCRICGKIFCESCSSFRFLTYLFLAHGWVDEVF